MARESAGSVVVQIDGDASPLIAKFAETEMTAKAAGQRIASGLGSGLDTAKQATEQFGRAITSGVTQPMAQAEPQVNDVVVAIQRLTTAMQEEGAASSLAAQRNAALASAVSEGGHHAQESESLWSGLFEKLQEGAVELGLTIGVWEALKDAVQVDAEIQKTTVAITHLTGSASTATEVIKELEELAKDDAISFGELLPAAQRFIAMGFAVEQLKPSMDAVANAAWALGVNVQSMSERVDGMALAGMAANRQLKTLGINTEDMARVMGVSEKKVAEVFKDLDIDTRLEVLTAALQKFSHTAQAEAQTVSGKWIGLKNTWHEVMASLGNDLRPFTELLLTTGNLATKTLGGFVNMLANLKEGVMVLIDPTRLLHDNIGALSGDIKNLGSSGNPTAPIKTAVETAAELAKKVHDAIAKHDAEDTELQQKLLDAKRTAFKEYYDDRLADLKSAHEVTHSEELRFRRVELADAQSRGPSFAPVARQVNRQVGTLSQEVDRGVDSTVREGQKLQIAEAKNNLKELQRDMVDGLRESSREAERDIDQALQLIQSQTQKANRAAEEGIKAGGVRDQSSDEIAKLQMEQTYALQIVHSKADELNYAQQIAAADEKSLRDKLATLQVLHQFEVVQGLYDEANRTDLEIEQAKANIRKKEIEDETKLAVLKRNSSLSGQIQSAVGKGPANLIDAKNLVIAQTMGSAVNGIAGAFGRAVQGGQKLGQIFSQLGKQILGEVVSAIVKIGLQMITTALLGKAAGSAIAVAEVTSAAAVGAANAAASTAAIPIIGPELAPAVAAATFAEIMAFAPLASFDKGGYIDDDQIARVHKGEFVLTADQVAGRSPLPDLPDRGGFGSSSLLAASSTSNASSVSVGAIHMHGVRDMRDVARRLPAVLKAVSPVFSPATR